MNSNIPFVNGKETENKPICYTILVWWHLYSLTTTTQYSVSGGRRQRKNVTGIHLAPAMDTGIHTHTNRRQSPDQVKVLGLVTQHSLPNTTPTPLQLHNVLQLAMSDMQLHAMDCTLER